MAETDWTKKQGKQAVSSQFREQLDVLGVKIIEVIADGNCFFRALADQIEGNEEEHMKYRHMVNYNKRNNHEMFEPFIEDEVPFDEYCQSIENDGTWAGHMELQIDSLVTRSNICIHRNMSPRWYIWNFDDRGVHIVHLMMGFFSEVLRPLICTNFHLQLTTRISKYFHPTKLPNSKCKNKYINKLVKLNNNITKRTITVHTKNNTKLLKDLKLLHKYIPKPQFRNINQVTINIIDTSCPCSTKHSTKKERKKEEDSNNTIIKKLLPDI
ncbi:hypothetical protein UlMin_027483 [Ulmus minor]